VKINGIENKSYEYGEKNHNLGLGGILGIGLGQWREIGWGELWL
jgi:hypothetical protein